MNRERSVKDAGEYRPIGVGDLVRVFRACRLPHVKETIGIGEVERITRTGGEALYWVRGFHCARTERELQRTITLSERWAAQEAREHE